MVVAGSVEAGEPICNITGRTISLVVVSHHCRASLKMTTNEDTSVTAALREFAQSRTGVTVSQLNHIAKHKPDSANATAMTRAEAIAFAIEFAQSRQSAVQQKAARKEARKVAKHERAARKKAPKHYQKATYVQPRSICQGTSFLYFCVCRLCDRKTT